MTPKPPAPQTSAVDLRTVVTDMLGDLAFMISDDETPEWCDGAVWMHGEVRYLGPVTGTLHCWCSRNFAIQLAANLLGIEADEGEAQVAAEDAVREFLNVLCGHCVTHWYGSKPTFDISIPVVCESTERPDAALREGDNRCELSINGEPLLCIHRPQR